MRRDISFAAPSVSSCMAKTDPFQRPSRKAVDIRFGLADRHDVNPAGLYQVPADAKDDAVAGDEVAEPGQLRFPSRDGLIALHGLIEKMAAGPSFAEIAVDE